MMTIQTELDRWAYDAPAHRVYTRAAWVEQWVERSGLYCNWCQFESSPNLPRAELEWDYGQYLAPGALGFAERAPLDLAGHFVKIEIDQLSKTPPLPQGPIRWYGRILEDARDLAGSVTDTIGGVEKTTPTGRQRLDCAGLELDLDRTYLTTSVIEGGAEPRIGRAIAVNRGGGHLGTSDLHAAGNRSEDLGTKDTFLFAASLAGARMWQADELVMYVLAYHAPSDVPWQLDLADSQLGFLRWYQPALELHGLSIRELLNLLVDRRRLSAWTVRVRENQGALDDVLVYVYSLTPNPIASTLGNQVLPANPYQRQLNFDASFDVASAVLTRSSLHAVDQVRAVGARRTSTFTLSGIDGSLQADWTVLEQTKYNLAASLRQGYAALDRSDKEHANDVARAERAVRRVFSYFVINPEWDTRAAKVTFAGSNDPSPPRPVNPRLDDEGQIVEGEVDQFWYPGIRLLHALPLKADRDYSQGDVADPWLLDGTPPGAESQHMRPFAVVAFRSEDGTSYEALDLADVQSQSRDELAGDGGRHWSGALEMRDDAPGLLIHIASPYQHVIGLDVPTQIDYSDWVFEALTGVEEIEPEVAWYRDLAITVCWQTDQYCEVVWPTPQPGGPVNPREERIELGDDYRLDYLAPYTIVGVHEGQIQQTEEGGFVRDDRDRLEALAQVAYEWYGRQRQALSLAYRQVEQYLLVGELVTQIGAAGNVQEVNAAVTAIRYDLAAGTTQVTTDFGELDLPSFGARIQHHARA